MLKPWTHFFKSHILNRGWDYYETGSVTSLSKTETGYRATVEGSNDYDVEIEVCDNEVVDMYCDCPYAEDGNFCKHMAAVLYQIEAGHNPPELPKNNLYDLKTELKDVISGIDESELRHMLLQLALKDNTLQNHILINYAEQISPSQMSRMSHEVEMIARQHSDRTGYVDYYQAMAYVQDMDQFLCENVQSLIDKNLLMQAFELTNVVFHTIGNQDIDDSDGGITYVANSCYECWKEILDRATEEERNQMYCWFNEHRRNYVFDYLEDYVSDFLLNEFHDPALLLKQMQIIDEQIEHATESTGFERVYFSYYGYESAILKRLQIMKELNYSSDEISKYRQRFRHFSAIRELEIQEHLDCKEYEKAIEVLKESKELDNEYAGLVSKYSNQLIHIYQSTGQKEEYKKELIFQVFSCRQDDLQNVKLLKEQCDADEWCSFRQQIINAKSCLGIIYSFLEFEEQYDMLLQMIVDSGSVYLLDMYEKVLKRKYPDTVRDIYAKFIRRYAATASNRKAYQALMPYMKKIRKYPGGEDLANQIAQEWKSVYRRKPAMMDELRKAGF
ncbi:MAG: SWIM zinc finger family protein [Eubacteriaceae bacterium]|nr:SWIM zinc finger family protein [Eubacteriaceae bacterium]